MDEVKKKSMTERINSAKATLALPDELPARPDLSHLPDHVLRSNAVETLLQQNEELMSRLSVNLRRVSHLENTMDSQENAVKKFKHHYEVLKDEVYILNEKSKKTEHEIKKRKTEHLDLLEKYKAIDFEYSKLFQEHNQEKNSFLAKNHLLGERLKRYIKYKKNITPLVKKLRRKHRELEASHKEYEQQNETLKAKLETLTTYIQNQSETFYSEKEQLLSNYKENTATIGQQDEKIRELKNQLEKVNDELVTVKNDNIFKTRTLDEMNQEQTDKLSTKMEEAESYRKELKKIKMENIEISKNSDELKELFAAEKSENEEISEQLENTQLFFSSLQKQFEKEQSKTHSLQKINRQLSQEMNAYRGTIQSLKDLRDEKLIQQKEASSHEQKEMETKAIDKIENLIFEIEKDFR